MRTQPQIKKLRRRFATGAIALIAVVLTAGMFAGCGKKKRTQVVPPPIVGPGVGNGCPTCAYGAGSGQFLMSAIGASGMRSVELALEFYANGTTVNGPTTGTNPPYYGGAFAYGMLYVLSNSTCNIPVGAYSLRPAGGQPGRLNDKSIYDMVLETTGGPAAVTVYVPNNYVINEIPPAMGQDGKMYPFRLQNKVWIVAPDGYSCDYILN